MIKLRLTILLTGILLAVGNAYGQTLYFELNASAFGALPTIFNDDTNNNTSNTSDWVLNIASSATAVTNGTQGRLVSVISPPSSSANRLSMSGYPKSSDNASYVYRTSSYHAGTGGSPTAGSTNNTSLSIRRLTTSSKLSQTVYVSFLASVFQITGNTGTNSGNANFFSYPIAFTNFTGTTNTIGARLLIYNTDQVIANSRSANYHFGIQKTDDARSFDTNKTYVADGDGTGTPAVFVLLKLVTDGIGGTADELSLYTSTSFPASEPTTWDITVNTGSDIDLNALLIREDFDNTAPTDHQFNFNNLRVADSWAGLFQTSTTWDGTNWSFGTPGSGVDGVVNADLTLSSNATYGNLTINSGKTVTVNSGVTLNLKGNLTTTGTLDVLSGASLLTYSTATLGSNVKVHRNASFADGVNQYSFIGSPVSGMSISSLNSGFHYTYNTADDTYSSFSGTMTPGVGYTSAGKQDLVFTGTPNKGDITFTLNTTGNGFNFVSNPYAAAISRSTFVTDNTAIDGAIYLWDDGGSNAGQRTNADFITVTSAGAVSGGSGNSANFNGNIASAQGFLVKASSAGTVTFKESQRVSGNNSDAAHFRKSSSEFYSIKLNIEGFEQKDQTLLAFTSEGTLGFDRMWDADKAIVNTNVKIFTLMNAAPMAIQALPELNSDMQDIELGLKVSQEGAYQISIAQSLLPEGFSAYLVNKTNGVVYSLSATNSVTLNLSNGTNADYALRLSRVGGVLASNESLASFLISRVDNNLKITFAQNPGSANVQIMDISGRLIFKADYTNAPSEILVPMKGNASDIFILKAKTATYGIITQKFKLN